MAGFKSSTSCSQQIEQHVGSILFDILVELVHRPERMPFELRSDERYAAKGGKESEDALAPLV